MVEVHVRQIDRADADLVGAHRCHRCHVIEREAGEVVPVCVSVERNVEIRPGVRAHRHESDLERHADPVDLLGSLTRDVVGDLRFRETRIRQHSGGDVVAEVDVIGHEDSVTVALLPRPPIAQRFSPHRHARGHDRTPSPDG